MGLLRRIGFVILLLTVCVCAGAQGKKQLDSLKYIQPQFSEGTVIFADKHMSRGTLNISPFDQIVYCVISGKDTLSVAGNPDIISVSVDGRSFVRWRDSFVEIVASDGSVGVGIIRSTDKVNNVKTGAYGMATSSSSVRTYSVDANTGNFHDLIIDDPRNYVYSQSPCLFSGGKYFTVSRKAFEKLFPEQKAFIESVWAERDIDIADVDSVIDFYRELLDR